MSDNTTDKHNPLVIVKEFADDGVLQVVNSYGGGGFRIAKQSYTGHQLVMPRKTVSWDITTPQQITLDSLAPALSATEMPEMILFGLGSSPQTPLFELRALLAEQNIKTDIMSTAAACRTWNILLTEGRAAAVALLAVD